MKNVLKLLLLKLTSLFSRQIGNNDLNTELQRKKVFLVLVGSKIGGTEKRFLELWHFFQDQKFDEVKLVISTSLYEESKKISYFIHLKDNNTNIFLLKGDCFRKTLKELFILSMCTNKEVIFHYPGVTIPFLHNITRNKFILSNTISSFFQGEYSSLKTKLLFLGSALTAWKIDILNPNQYEDFKKRFPYFKNKISLTPQNFVNINVYKSRCPKKNDIVFLGRLPKDDTKNVIPFVKAIPYISQFLSQNNIRDFRFFILGHGALEKQVQQILSEDRYAKIPVFFQYEPNPCTILSYSKIILSLQKYSNYPSRSLLEGMSCGNLPIVTDVGETRLIAKENFSKFISPEIKETELASAIFEILNLNCSNFLDKSITVRKFIVENYSINSQARYYLSLYNLNECSKSVSSSI